MILATIGKYVVTFAATLAVNFIGVLVMRHFGIETSFGSFFIGWVCAMVWVTVFKALS